MIEQGVTQRAGVAGAGGRRLATVWTFFAALIFGLGVVLARLLGGALDASLVALVCLSGGGLLLAGWLALRGVSLAATARALSRADWWNLLLLAVVGTALPLLCVVAGFPRTSAVTGGFLMQLNGVAALLFAVLLLGERIRLRQTLGIALLLFGSGLIVLAGGSAGGVLAGGSGLGDLLVALGAVGIGFGYIPAKRLAERVETLPVTALRLLVGAASIAPVVVVELIVNRQGLLWRPTLGVVLVVLPLYIVSNFCLAYLSQQEGLRLLQAWEVAAIMQMVPLFTVVFALVLLGERVNAWQVFGGLLALGGGLVVAVGEASAPGAGKVE
jgi:drug/metabolite transporter (DMT)-like permease